MVTRYDRRLDADGIIARVHQEDLCQALRAPPSDKYQNEGGPTPAQIVRLLRNAMPPRVGEDAVGRFADALIWNWLLGGTDAHAKNYSVLLAGDQARLAPLYDIASALPYGTHERKLRLAMKVGSSYEVYPQRTRWPEAARDLGLDAAALVDRALELARIAPEALADAVGASGVTALNRDSPRRFLDLVNDRAARCLKVLTTLLATS